MKYFYIKSIKHFFIIVSLASIHYAYSAHFSDHKTSYLFAPGLHSYETQLAKYLPTFTAITGEKISATNGIHVINQPATICKFPEIKLLSTKELFLHPIDVITSSLIRARNHRYGVQIISHEDKTDYEINGHASDLSKINFGQ